MVGVSDKPEKTYPNKDRRDAALDDLEKSLKSRERKAKAAPLGVIVATLVVLVVLVGGIWYAATYQPDQDNTADSSDQQTSEPQTQNAALPAGPLKPYGQTVNCEFKADGEAAKPVTAPDGKDVPATGTENVTLKTNDGDIGLTLENSKSPCATFSFEHLVKAGYYNNTVCHRSVKSSSMTILQCGDPTGQGTGGPGYSFPDEYPTNGVEGDAVNQPVTYPRGTLAMANSGENTNGSQFFLVTGDTTLPPKYSIFGTISESGLQTLDKILEKAPEGDGKPSETVTIDSAQMN